MKKLDFLPNLRNRYSIRRFTVGTASILIGSLLFLGHNGEAKAAENTNDNTVVEASKDISQTQQETVNNTTPQENTSETLQQDKDTQAIQNELESVKTEAVSKFAIFTHLSEDARQQYIAEVKQAQSKADVLAVVDKAQKAEEELVKQAEQAKQADQTKQVEQEKPEKPADTANVQTETKAETESVKTEEKTEPSSATASETPKTSEAETVTTPNNTTPSIDATPLSTVQKVDKVKKELAPNYDSSKVDEALAIIDTNDLTAEQIKAEILTILLAQGSAEKDLYSPQATLPRSEEGNTRYAVRAVFDINTDLKNEVVVTKDNFNDYFWTIDDATYDPATGIATLTPNEKSKKGSVSLDTKLNINKDFHFSGAINLGDKGEGHEKDGVPGGDGIGFMFNPGDVHQLGLYGAGLGYGGLPFSFGFKFDTYVNNAYDKNGKALADPKEFNGKGAFGAFVYANAGGEVLTQVGSDTFKAALLNQQPHDNQFVDLKIDYDAATKVMTINYGGQVWSQKMTTYFNYSKKKAFALSIGASTGGAYNLQQVRIDRFTYTASALLEENFVDEATQELINKPIRTSGDIDDEIEVADHTAMLQKKGYEINSIDTSLASDYSEDDNTVTLTNAAQFIVYKLRDVQAPVIEDISNATSNADTPINPITLDISDNSGKIASKTVTGLPEGLTFNEQTNEITGTPTKVGTTTVTVTATDFTNLSTTKTFTYTVAGTTAPVITAVDNKAIEAYTPIAPITVGVDDDSKDAPTLTVTGLPEGLTFDPTTKQITGKPTAEGTSTVTITATDASNNASTSTFDIVVQPNTALEALKTAVAEAKTVAKDEYTPNSVAALDAKVAEAEALIAHPENGSTDAFNTKAQEVKDAKDQLVRNADKTELDKAITKAGTLGQLNAGDTEDKAVQDALATANQVKADGNATPEQVAAATEALNNAVAAKDRHDALDELNAAIQDADAVTKDNYTPETVTLFDTAITEGKAKAADNNATPEQIKAATQAIKDAKNTLKQKANKVALNQSVTTAEALQPLNAGDAEDDAVKAALEKAKQVQANPNADQTDVDTAKTELDLAVQAKQTKDAADALKQAALDDLKAELAKVAKVDKNNFTPDSVQPLTDKEADSNAIVAAPENKTVDEIKAATEALKEAAKGLQAKSDKAALQATVDKAEALPNLDAADKEDKAVQDALTAAKVVKDNPNATQQEVQQATEALNNAVAAKDHQDALDELQNALNDANQVNKDQYKPDSVTPFETAVNAGTVAKDDATKTPTELKEAAKAIKDAKNALQEKANKTDLNTSVQTAEGLGQLDPADAEDKAVQDALAKAKTVQADQNTDQAAVDAAKTELDNAVNAKKAADAKETQDAAAAKQAALDALKAELAKVKALDKTAYTPNTVTPLSEKEVAGKAIVDAPDAKSTEEIKAATQALKDAEKALKSIADKTALEEALDKAVVFENLDNNDTEDKALHDALLAGQEVEGDLNATPEAVKKAADDLNNALAAKERQDVLDELQKAIDAAKAVNKDDYKPNTVTPLEAAVTAGETAKADATQTPEQLKAATKAINDAKAALQAKANKTDLNTSVQAAEGLGQLDPADAEDKAVQDALAKAKDVQAD